MTTQCERLEAALRANGPHGICEFDYSTRRRRGTVDGGPPIADVAGRIRELARHMDIVPGAARHGARVWLLAEFEPPYVSGWACLACGSKLGGGPVGTFAGGCPECGGFPVIRLAVVRPDRTAA